MTAPTTLPGPTIPVLGEGRWPSVLLICDRWSPARGAISKFNRALAIAFAQAGHRTTCLVERASQQERRDAESFGVTLRMAERTPAGPNFYLPSAAVLDSQPDVVVGHDVVTGSVAWTYARKYLKTSKLVLIVHSAPNEPYEQLGEIPRPRDAREGEICGIEADLVAAVGPKLTREAEGIVGDGFGSVPVLQLDPGMHIPTTHAGRTREVPRNMNVTMTCRTGHIRLKGLDIVSAAIAEVTGQPRPRLLIQGPPRDKCVALHERLLVISQLPTDRLDVRPFKEDFLEIGREIGRSALFVLPARVEGFGLAALDAISLGTPILVSDQSGIAETLRAHLGEDADPFIVDVVDDPGRDIPRWREAIQRVLANPRKAFIDAHELRDRLAGAMRWDLTVSTLVTRLAIPVPRMS
ncbi:glycosyltransferase family 4 protein [Actinocrispum sp. NPDC049592]|uniref:glycosyltransferase family 4 protein n=1 Tax=Actinocrispum sp. NPDC049592 TaxID=3154835 RepID=UPI003435F9D8